GFFSLVSAVRVPSWDLAPIDGCTLPSRGNSPAIDSDSLRAASGAFARRPECRCRADPGMRIQGGAAFDENSYRLRMVLSHSQHQRRLLEFRVDGIDVRSTVDQKPERIRCPGTGGGHQDCFTSGIDNVGICAGLQESPNDLAVAVNRSQI